MQKLKASAEKLYLYPEENRRSFDYGGRSTASAQDDNFYSGYILGTALVGGSGGGGWRGEADADAVDAAVG